MEMKGRHSGEDGNFYRDLAIMVGGILGVGALVFFLLFLWAGDTSSQSTTTSSTTTTSPSPDESSTSPGTSTTAPTPTDPTTVPVRPNSEVRVVVLNSVGIAGSAGRFTQTLADEGYQTLEAGDFRPEQDPTRIWFRDGFSAEANALAESMSESSGTLTLVEPLPDETLQPGADLIVVLGTGYQE